MNNITARAVQSTVQFIVYTLMVSCFFLIPSILEGLIFGATA
ncbi:hypothetical protein [Arthrobacter sp. PAMC25284]|nr:hypothetical protein [Arthrobacter sp. PAMC25284]